MNELSIFFKFRAAVFNFSHQPNVVLITFISLVFTTLLCVELFVRWDASDSSQRKLVLVLVLINSCTSVVLPALFIVPFKSWLDGVQVFSLFLFQLGTAVIFTLWSPTFLCPGQATTTTCRQINVSILVGSWVTPTLLLVYAVGWAVLLFRNWRHAGVLTLPEKRQSELPMMSPPPDPESRMGSLSIPSGIFDGAAPPLPPQSSTGLFTSNSPKHKSSSEEDRSTTRSSARLSKPIPKWFY
ncbi:uncharacterized protein FIBRA_00442 [Fibroporia radiculosa]|uniref:Uncharacterized protein n=1 Tax=Fibroporia radiculosa TaxID=599839 RepID=J4GHS3_9APHY|nr:uncharacterized protein FIBRA_00442 [Fibroporia radiculosa]CCL98445.1 predicted protein [Fibroporia radiculosa]